MGMHMNMWTGRYRSRCEGVSQSLSLSQSRMRTVGRPESFFLKKPYDLFEAGGVRHRALVLLYAMDDEHTAA